MIKWFQTFFRTDAQKASRAESLFSLHNVGKPRWSGRDFRNFSDGGYRKNAIVFTCINMIADAVASVPWYVQRNVNGKAERVDNHPLYDLMKKPNLTQKWSDLTYAMTAYKLICGNAYLERMVLGSGKLHELYVLRSDLMSVIGGTNGLPAGYQFEAGGSKELFDFDPITGDCDILHLKTFNPLDHWYGMSKMEAAAFAVDQHNEASNHNKAVLQNGASPSGAMIYKPAQGEQIMSPEQFKDLKKDFMEKYEGTRNAGRPLFLQGTFDWQQMGLTAREMDFIKGKDMSAREIGIIYGVPSQLLGIPDAQKYDNMEAADLYFWEKAVIPELNFLKQQFEWLTASYDDRGDLELCYDLDDVSAMIPRRQQRWDKNIKGIDSGLITINEAREDLGYPRAEGADELMIPANRVPLNLEITPNEQQDDPEGAGAEAYGDE